MDFVKKAAGGGSSGSDKQQGGGGGDDYVDKAFSAGASKTGHNISKDNQEKITDFGRNAYEKATGSKVDPKISN
ncbi:hypothetical protein N3K66_003715 [Trichothecium roseum]|uniref:Uncharacterized protein n=1 Tax=Trichothecium roseum TaxID=47278 RepID=A0ACC0V684_9HYPO|nr:hypothetical protein N3K66_003715 [Trichothecium roseum]